MNVYYILNLLKELLNLSFRVQLLERSLYSLQHLAIFCHLPSRAGIIYLEVRYNRLVSALTEFTIRSCSMFIPMTTVFIEEMKMRNCRCWFAEERQNAGMLVIPDSRSASQAGWDPFQIDCRGLSGQSVGRRVPT